MKKLLSTGAVASSLWLSVLALLPSTANAQSYSASYNQDYTFYIGYLNKDWVTEEGGKTYHENFWGEPDKRLHGMQIGVIYQPSLSFGLGLRTGLSMEFCSSSSDFVHEMGWDNYNEFSLYLPLQLAWRIPLGSSVSITPFCGLGFNWAAYGTFQERDYYYYSYDGTYYGPTEFQKFGNGEAPKRWNNQLEYGADLHIGAFSVSATWSRGLRDHELYKGFETFQNKFAINIGLLLDL